ncbi:GTP 3',8-cyclase MoaA [bacterium]|nr:MAG: GTP 3',8-cyclase MoaA [bacterium]
MSGPALLDSFSRRINYLRISVTDRCNLRCRYCMPAEGVKLLGHGEVLTYEELLRVARIALETGISKIRITGGEPLVRRGICDFLRQLSSLGGLKDLALTTNGTLLSEMAEDLRAAGLRRINVSLDTLKPETFAEITRVDALQKVLDGIAAAKRAGLDPVKVNVVVMRGVNDGEIPDFVNFASDNDLEVRFIEFMPSRDDTWEKSALVPAEEILGIISSRFELTPVEREVSAGPCRVFRLPKAGRIGVISPMSDHFCGECNRVRLTADGKLRGCLFSSRELDLKTILRDPAQSDEAVKKALLDTIMGKPEGHKLEERSDAGEKCGLSMNRVGG